MHMGTASLRVRFEEIATDHVYYGNYFAWLELGLAELFRTQAVPYTDYEKQGLSLVTVETLCNYRSPARYDDEVRIHTHVAKAAPKRMLLEHQIVRAGEEIVLAEGRSAHVMLGQSGQVVPLPSAIMALAEAEVETVSALEGERSVDCTKRLTSGETQVRVRYKETDGMKHAYFSTFYTWFEVGRTELFRQVGLSFDEIHRGGAALPVASAYCQYLAPASYDHRLVVGTAVCQLRRTKVTFSYEVKNADDGTLVATGYTVHGHTDSNGKPIPMPAEMTAALAGGAVPGRGPT